ncbi:rCG23955, isoform CRA_a [Rattus norvegicus]|uniref:RCG23955, isoform CRA_a n=1 Tax=Rattus norvegicus TaxID=10116 RepID=A6JVS0_RAT|nr:rCG23955, isoform CRA_a [Rattus norvegicus]
MRGRGEGVKSPQCMGILFPEWLVLSTLPPASGRGNGGFWASLRVNC